MANKNLCELEFFIKEYGHLLNPEAIIKEDILRQGVFFESFTDVENFSSKSYFIFSFNIDNDNDVITKKYPEEIAIQNGPYNLKRTVISVRINKSSPYRVKYDPVANKYTLFHGGHFIGDAVFSPEKSYMLQKTPSGKSVRDVAPTIEWGYLIYLAVFRMCQYFENHNECAFCDMNSNYVSQKKANKSYSAVKSIGDIIDALGIIGSSEDSRSKAYTLTGGSIIDEVKFNGDAEIDFYVRFLEAIEDKYKGKWISKVVVQAHDTKNLKRLKDAGAYIYHTNFEVWDKRLFDNICPGKSKFIGRDEWIKRIVDAVPIFGEYKVIPNFVAGVELSSPYGFDSIDDAINSTAEGLEFFMSHNVIPRYTTWCPEKTSKLGRMGNPPAPLEYYVKLLLRWHELHYKYNLPIPEGYGEAGPGKAEFSVSAFMDAFKIGDAV
ncbi:MAG: radical SAM protein [Deltaproteobacteria bacterium]|nr:radical SAM protein [Deltaproteobacteria bacterium]